MTASKSEAEQQVARMKAEMEEKERKYQEMLQAMEDLKREQEDTRNFFAETNKDRMKSTYETFQQYNIDVDANKEDFARIYGERQNYGFSQLLDKIAGNLKGHATESERLTKALQDRETELKSREEDMGKLTSEIQQYKAAFEGESKYEPGKMFDMSKLNDMNFNGRSSIMVNGMERPEQSQGQAGQAAPMEVTNSRTGPNGEPPRKRARNGRPISKETAQMMEAFSQLPPRPVTHAEIARREGNIRF